MSNSSPADIRRHLESLAAPAGLRDLAVRFCEIQGTLSPTAMPRRLVLFAGATVTTDSIREILTGAAAVVVLAKTTHTDLVLIDVGSPADPQPDSPRYRARKVRPASRKTPLTPDEFRAAFIVGQHEADRAANDSMKVVAAGAVNDDRDAADAAIALLSSSALATDPVAMIAPAATVEIAAMAGFFAKAAERGLTIVLDGSSSLAALKVAEMLYPDTAAKVTDAGESSSALLAFPLLDSAAALARHAAARVAADAVPATESKLARRVAVFTGSFDPPTTFHRKVARLVRGRGFDEVIVRPTAQRPDQPDGEHAEPVHRAVMADLAFRDLPGVSVDLDDLDNGTCLPDHLFDEHYADRGDVWHVVSADFVIGGRSGESDIQSRWENGAELWKTGRFVVLHPTNAPPDAADLPPVSKLVPIDDHMPTADIRRRVFDGGEARPHVPEAVDAYIHRYRLFSGIPSPRETSIAVEDPRLMIVADENNPKARELAKRFRPLESSDPTLILVLGGDGTMLAAIRKHWRQRLPFLGLNAGTLGFLMNEELPENLAGLELVVYRMPMLRVDMTAPNGHTTSGLAYSDAWLERDSGQAAWLRVDVDDRTQVPKVVGDGLLVATPSGSSAYARAMGATPVPLTAPVLTLAGSNVFRPRFWKPVALPETATVRFTNLDTTGKRPVRAFLDGHLAGLATAMAARVSSVATVELAFTPQFDLSERLLRSLFPPSEEA